MTNEERLLFEEVRLDREDSVKALRKVSIRGALVKFVDMYSEQAHFIYELLQNADDAGATHARFELRSNELLFAHNGTRHFSISPLEREDIDTELGTLGDLNSITSVANSNKTSNAIGKFGVGFKAVFHYTRTPHIYDPCFHFKIEQFIIPILLDDDHPERKADETLFIFPFDRAEIGAEQAEREIAEKLAALIQPTLFLNHLLQVHYKHGNIRGSYNKTIKTGYVVNNDIKVELLDMWQRNFGIARQQEPSQKFWMFTRTERFEDKQLDISIGFLLEQGKLAPAKYNAFCFFPTKEKTGLNFIIHAPFLLTENRENIRAAEEFNRLMIQKLAELAADALVVLKTVSTIDNGILDIVPCNAGAFDDNPDQISFRPFYYEIKERLRTDELLPTAIPKKYVASKNAYWDQTGTLNQLFSNEQLRMVTGNPNAAWVFTSIESGRSFIRDDYIKDIVAGKACRDGNFLPRITGEFIEQQKIYWLKRLYEHALDCIKLARTLPIFLDQDRKASPAFYEDDREALFMPSSVLSGYPTVYKELLKDDEIKACLVKFGIKSPSIKDEIYNKILPKYDCDDEFDTREDISIFFRYYHEKAQLAERTALINTLMDVRFVFTIGGRRCLPCDVYFHSEELAAYFKGVKAVNFMRLSDYASMFGSKRELGELKQFFKSTGVSENAPQIVDRVISENMIEKCIDGCREVLDRIKSTRDKSKSLLLWRMLARVFDRYSIDPRNPKKVLYCETTIVSRFTRSKKTASTDIDALRHTAWLFDRDGNCRKPGDLDRASLAAEYERDDRLMKFLQIPEAQNLTAEQKRKIELANRLEEAGITERELDELIRTRRKSKAEPKSDQPKAESKSEPRSDQSSRAEQESRSSASNPISDIIETADADSEKQSAAVAVDFDKELAKLDSEYQTKLDAINQKKALSELADTFPKYSYGWFKTLLELEKLNSDTSTGREISINFSQIEREPNSERTVILKYPSRSIPQSIEELTDVQLKLFRRGEQIAKPIIDAISIKSFRLRVKLKNADAIADIDLTTVDQATIEATNPIFLLQELTTAFDQLKCEPNFDMKKHLPKNIEFIFGPPGTGKTTHLAREVLIPKMLNSSACKILVLAPTNKAADVLAARIVSNCRSCKDWLIRFGACNDESLEQFGVFHDKTLDIRKYRRAVTVTTIARFPYDYFIANEERLFLKDLNWDYIVIDEASMIPLVNIILPLYRKTPHQFIIAGDPFQIEPITHVAQWADENIYTMIGLNSFQNPTTEPHRFKIRTLTTQYRSIPTVGKIFSRFAYDGVLKHYRNDAEQRPLNIPTEILDIKTLNIVKFPVKRYESVYRAKKLAGGSPYHIYSALFTFEFVRYLADLIAEHNSGKTFSIGIITPYRAEGDLINKLTASIKLPSGITINVGTIHGFQGDECDIILAVFNPPQFISADAKMFLNRLNILNVSISRARDYLFVIMPDDQTIGIDNLRLVKRIETLLKSSASWCEMQSNALEKIMFGSENFIEENAFSTAHQDVNIYGSVERRYEIRSEDSALDIQLHEDV